MFWWSSSVFWWLSSMFWWMSSSLAGSQEPSPPSPHPHQPYDNHCRHLCDHKPLISLFWGSKQRKCFPIFSKMTHGQNMENQVKEEWRLPRHQPQRACWTILVLGIFLFRLSQSEKANFPTTKYILNKGKNYCSCYKNSPHIRGRTELWSCGKGLIVGKRLVSLKDNSPPPSLQGSLHHHSPSCWRNAQQKRMSLA